MFKMNLRQKEKDLEAYGWKYRDLDSYLGEREIESERKKQIERKTMMNLVKRSAFKKSC